MADLVSLCTSLNKAISKFSEDRVKLAISAAFEDLHGQQSNTMDFPCSEAESHLYNNIVKVIKKLHHFKDQSVLRKELATSGVKQYIINCFLSNLTKPVIRASDSDEHHVTGWRVDVTVCSSSLSRVLEPSVVLHLQNSRSVEMTLPQFQLLRFHVAQCIKQMNSLALQA